ncbi:hypothetical protein [Brevibacillus brevis]|uniref:Uncharacterized protein n=1 Tax=Brevibacillus brevis TaxID=1393 RepID=A0A517IAF0_BREBE|nr:hypothetical protein [Brevibacillus brevis]QDS35858.1 hypothetical protein FPS98_18565 [Brevibacillus brevis]
MSKHVPNVITDDVRVSWPEFPDIPEELREGIQKLADDIADKYEGFDFDDCTKVVVAGCMSASAPYTMGTLDTLIAAGAAIPAARIACRRIFPE